MHKMKLMFFRGESLRAPNAFCQSERMGFRHKKIPSNFSRVRRLSAHNSNKVLLGNYLTTVSWADSRCWPHLHAQNVCICLCLCPTLKQHLDALSYFILHILYLSWAPQVDGATSELSRAFNLHGSICIFCAAFFPHQSNSGFFLRLLTCPCAPYNLLQGL